MGYYTYFSLEARGIDDGQANNIVRWLENNGLYGFDGSFYRYRDGAYEFGCRDSMKWSSCEEDMKELSRAYPDAVFCLNGEGEDWDDKWRQFFKDGESEYCPVQISYPEPVTIKWD